MKNSAQLKCVTLPLANMDPYTSVRTIISYYSSIQKTSYRYCQRLYLRHGSLVVSIVRNPKEPVHHMLRRTLIALAIYPDFLRHVPLPRSRYILSAWVKCFFKVKERQYMRLPLATLYVKASLSMVNIQSLISGGRITLTTSPNVKDTVLQLHVSVCTLIQSIKLPAGSFLVRPVV